MQSKRLLFRARRFGGAGIWKLQKMYDCAMQTSTSSFHENVMMHSMLIVPVLTCASIFLLHISHRLHIISAE